MQQIYALYAVTLGHLDPAVEAARRAVNLDPQNWWAHYTLAWVYVMARRFGEAQTALQPAQVLNPASHQIGAVLVDILLGSGQIQLAEQTCESSATPLGEDERRYCLALVYHAQGRQADAERELRQFPTTDGYAYEDACTLAQWGDPVSALQWLTKAEQLGDPSLGWLKVDWRLDPIRNDPQFKAILARMKFPP